VDSLEELGEMDSLEAVKAVEEVEAVDSLEEVEETMRRSSVRPSFPAHSIDMWRSDKGKRHIQDLPESRKGLI
jgi:hypothetical protein